MGSNGRISALYLMLVAEIWAFIAACIPRAFTGVAGAEGGVGIAFEANIVENEKFGFGAKINGVGNAGRLQIGFGFGGNMARIAAVGLTGNRVKNIADKTERWHFHEWIELGCGRVGMQLHIGGMHGLPAWK